MKTKAKIMIVDDAEMNREILMVILGDEYEYVQEFGEGVDRLYEVMETAGLPQPEYRVEAFMLYATIRNTKTDANLGDTPQVTPQVKIIAFCSEPRSKAEIANYCGFKSPNIGFHRLSYVSFLRILSGLYYCLCKINEGIRYVAP